MLCLVKKHSSCRLNLTAGCVIDNVCCFRYCNKSQCLTYMFTLEVFFLSSDTLSTLNNMHPLLLNIRQDEEKPYKRINHSFRSIPIDLF